jgi:hypothetical protein
MAIEPPDPFQIAEALRAQLVSLRELASAYPTRGEYQDAANLASKALARLEAAIVVKT